MNSERTLMMTAVLIALMMCVVPALGGIADAAPGGNSSSSSVTYSGATTITSATTQTGQTYSSTTADQNAVLVNL